METLPRKPITMDDDRLDAEERRIAEDARREKNWKRWGRSSQNGNGALPVRIIQKTDRAGTIFRTIMPGA
ncbi:MAG: hypothetical protein ICV76_07375, partial [Nitrospiraceae bacterium]|nr:hypothetical protein [Nitrospiraceae bacterium]